MIYTPEVHELIREQANRMADEIAAEMGMTNPDAIRSLRVLAETAVRVRIGHVDCPQYRDAEGFIRCHEHEIPLSLVPHDEMPDGWVDARRVEGWP